MECRTRHELVEPGHRVNVRTYAYYGLKQYPSQRIHDSTPQFLAKNVGARYVFKKVYMVETVLPPKTAQDDT
jgi:hypothetical protein